MPLRADIGILPNSQREDFKSLDWPYKGIVLEFDGPHHYYAPAYNNSYEPTRFTKNRIDLINCLEGYKVFIIPFYMHEMPHELNIFDTFDEGTEIDPQNFKIDSQLSELQKEITEEYFKMKRAYGDYN